MNIKNIKILVSHIVGVALLIALTNLTISYSKSEFELPFYDRTKSNLVQIDSGTVPRDRDTVASQTEKPTEDITSVMDRFSQSDFLQDSTDDEFIYQTGDNVDSVELPFEIMSDEMLRQGYAVNDGVYEIFDEARTNSEITRYKNEVNRILGEITDEDDETPTLPDKPVLYEYKFVQIEPEVPLPLERRAVAGYDSKTTAEAIMDYILIRTVDKENDEIKEFLCSASGKIISRDFTSLDVEILRMRDEQDRTVFKKDGMYFIYDPDYVYETESGESRKGGFYSIAFDELLGDRGVPFMYPSYYGANGANGLDRSFNDYNKKWGYANAGKPLEIKFSRIYLMTFNFMKTSESHIRKRRVWATNSLFSI